MGWAIFWNGELCHDNNQYGIVPVTLALALLIKFLLFHGLKTGFFCYSLKLNFICCPNRFFTYDYSLWDGGRPQKQTLIFISSRHLFVHFVLPFSIKGPLGRLSFSYANLLAFLFSVDKSIGSGCFFPDLDPSVNLIGHAAITEMIKLQFTTITDRIRNKIRNGNWFPKFGINRKEQKFLLICLRLFTLLTIIKDPSLGGLRGNQDQQKFDFWQP